MKNLAGHPDATNLWRVELTAAGLDTVPAATPDDETGAAIDGVADLGGGFALRAARRWVYASARITPPLPIDAGVEVNGAPFAGDVRSKYSSDDGTLGGVARAEGFAGGLPAAGLRDYSPEGVTLWHCDTTEALSALVATLRQVIATRDLTAADAAAEHARIHTARWVDECGPSLAGGGHVATLVRQELHRDPTLVATDPRVMALRAKYPAVPCIDQPDAG